MKTRIIVLSAFSAMLLLASCGKKEGGMAEGANAKADSMKTAYKAMSAAWDAGKADEMDKYISVDAKDHDVMPGMPQGLAGLKATVNMMHQAHPDMHSNIDYMGVDGDMLTVRYTVSGTNSGPMMGMPATNKKFSNVSGIDIVKWSNGKFVEHWGNFDAMSMMMQLGMMPPMGGGDHNMGMEPPPPPAPAPAEKKM